MFTFNFSIAIQSQLKIKINRRESVKISVFVENAIVFLVMAACERGRACGFREVCERANALEIHEINQLEHFLHDPQIQIANIRHTRMKKKPGAHNKLTCKRHFNKLSILNCRKLSAIVYFLLFFFFFFILHSLSLLSFALYKFMLIHF